MVHNSPSLDKKRQTSFWAIVVLLILPVFTGWAAPVNLDQARRAAEALLVMEYPNDPPVTKQPSRTVTSRGESKLALRDIQPLAWDDQRVAYVASLQPGGYMLLSADDEMPPLKLHADNGSFSNLPPAFIHALTLELGEDLLASRSRTKQRPSTPDSFKQQWRELLDPAGSRTKWLERTRAAPGVVLLTTAWDQGDPYNYYCPASSDGPGGRAYVGCSATAFGQILRYWRRPERVVRNLSYLDDKGRTQARVAIADAGLGAYAWPQMPDTVSPLSPLAQRQAIGQLLYHAAVALESDFGGSIDGGTGAYGSRAPVAFRQYFNYTCGDMEWSGNFTATQWFNKIARDIEANKPIYYTFRTVDGRVGHAVVCDGYRSGQQIHLNFGWSGASTAWYSLDRVVDGANRQWVSHQGVFGITPPPGGSIEPPPGNDQCAGALTLVNGAVVEANISSATSTGDPANSCGFPVVKGIWYKVRLDVATSIVLSTQGSDFDTSLAVYRGDCDGLDLVACDDDGGSGLTSRLSFTAAGGATYYILAGAAQGGGGNLRLTGQWTLPSVANDRCAGALTINPGETLRMNTLRATTTGDPSTTCVSGAGRGVWYKITPAVAGTLRVLTCGSNFDTVLALYEGSCDDLSRVACNDDTSFCSGSDGTSRESVVSYAVTAGQTYYIYAAGYAGAGGDLQITGELLVADRAPPNDDFAQAAILSGVSGSTGGSTIRSTRESGEPEHAGVSGGKSVWWRWTSPGNGIVKINTFGSNYDTVLAAYTGDSIRTLTEVASNDDDAAGVSYQSEITFEATSGQTYFIAVDGYAGDQGAVRLAWNMSGAQAPGAPQLVAPAEATTVVTAQPVFTWRESSPGADWYNLSLRRNGAPYTNIWVQEATWTPRQQLPEGDYRWRVRGWASSITGAWSPETSFTIHLRPGVPRILTPASNATLDSRRPVVTWTTTVPQARWYQVIVYRDGQPYEQAWTATTSWTPTGDLPAGSYTCWVRAYNSGGYSRYSSGQNFLIERRLPGQLTLIGPSGAQTNSANFAYQWNGDDATSYYNLLVQRDGHSMVNLWRISRGEEVFTQHIGGHQEGTTYRWKVRGWNPDGMGRWSEPMTFSTPEPVANRPVLVSPSGSISNRVPSFSWNAVSGAFWYRVVVESGSARVIDQWVQDTDYMATNRLVTGDYRWWIAAFDGASRRTAWSDPLNFTIGEVGYVYNITLTWGSDPVDLDAHLLVPGGRHVYFGSKGSRVLEPYAQLDVDDASGYGPENIAIYRGQAGSYKFYVHQYSSSGRLPASGARVRLVNSSGAILLDRTVPSTGSGQYWHVFDLDALTGSITSVNRIQVAAP